MIFTPHDITNLSCIIQIFLHGVRSSDIGIGTAFGTASSTRTFSSPALLMPGEKREAQLGGSNWTANPLANTQREKASIWSCVTILLVGSKLICPISS